MPDILADHEGRPSVHRAKPRMHWHVILTHFPISAFLGSFIFTGLHLITRNDCFVLSTYVSLVLGAVAMLPLTLTGWLTWARVYRKAANKGFLIKIWTAVAMIVVSIALAVYQTVRPFHALDLANESGHVLYLAAVLFLVTGAAVEGYYGGRLHHH